MKGFKTIAFNAAVAAATAAMAHFSDPVTLGELAGTYGPYVIIGVNVINMILRGMTNTPIARKE